MLVLSNFGVSVVLSQGVGVWGGWRRAAHGGDLPFVPIFASYHPLPHPHLSVALTKEMELPKRHTHTRTCMCGALCDLLTPPPPSPPPPPSLPSPRLNCDQQVWPFECKPASKGLLVRKRYEL